MASTIIPSHSFDISAQNVTFFLANGTQTHVTVREINKWYFYGARVCINLGTQIGACLIMFTVTAVLTKETKRRTPIFILNLLSLALGFVRALTLALYQVSTWCEFYAYMTEDWAYISKSAYGTSVVGTIIPLMMTITVNSSLCLQAYTVCKAMGKKSRFVINFFSSVVFLLAVGFRFAQCVTNSINIMTAIASWSQAWIQTGTLAMELVSIYYYSVIFTGKLLWTIYARRTMGLKSWSYIQILAAMGGCTMIIPSAFAILEFATPDTFPLAGTLALTLVAITLPLSSLWASMVTTLPSSEFNVTNLWAADSGSDFGGKSFHSSTTGQSSCYSRKGSTAPISPSTTDTLIERVPKKPRDSTEIDLEQLGVRVARTYSVHSGRDESYSGQSGRGQSKIGLA